VKDPAQKTSPKIQMAKLLIVGNPNSPLVRERGLVGRAAGHEISWYHRYKTNIPGVMAYSLPPKIASLTWLFHLFEPYYLARSIKLVRPDLIHVHSASTGLLALPLSRFHPLVVTAMGSDISTKVGYRGLYAPFTRRLLKSADCITVKSAYMEQMLLKIGDFAHKTERITWGVDLSLFRPGRTTNALRRKLEIPAGALVFLDPRKMHPLYNKHILLDAFRKYLNTNNPGAILLLVGFNPDPRYLKRLKEQVRIWNIENVVRFLPPQDREEMADLYALADVMISIPQSEGFPQSIYEAWASGLYMILGNLPHYRHVFVDGQTARLVPLGDPQAVADALSWVANHPEVRKVARDAGPARAKSIADKAEQTQIMNQIYARLLVKPI
jgi:glycosyltransferase involved in cell wall biosynthesis